MKRENRNLGTKQEKYMVFCRPAMITQTTLKQIILTYNFN